MRTGTGLGWVAGVPLGMPADQAIARSFTKKTGSTAADPSLHVNYLQQTPVDKEDKE
jgi:hypothetical protein